MEVKILEFEVEFGIDPISGVWSFQDKHLSVQDQISNYCFLYTDIFYNLEINWTLNGHVLATPNTPNACHGCIGVNQLVHLFSIDLVTAVTSFYALNHYRMCYNVVCFHLLFNCFSSLCGDCNNKSLCIVKSLLHTLYNAFISEQHKYVLIIL